MAALVAAGSVLLALVVILTTLPDAQATLRLALHLPAAPTPAGGADELLLDNIVPWGTLRLDGQAVGHDQLAPGLPYGYEALRLTAGRHALSYSAELFAPLTCTVSVPARSDDTCPLVGDAVSGQDLRRQNLQGARVLDLRAAPERLRQADRDRLIDAVNATLVPRTTPLSPGERYLDADGQPTIADQALTATLRLAVNTDPSRAAGGASGSTACLSLCAAPLGNQYPSNWTLQANVYVHWTFTAADGILVGSCTGALALGELTHLLPVLVSWQQGVWQVEGRDHQSDARVLFSALSDGVRQRWGERPLRDEFPSGWAVVPYIALNPADGSMIDIGVPSPIDGLPSGDTIEVLYRFGLLLAANDHARRTLPQLPVATAAELERWHRAA